MRYQHLYSYLLLIITSLMMLSCTEDGIDGLNGLSSLVNILDEPPGENCSDGGVRIETGIDQNANGTLDKNEIQQVSFACDGVSSPGEGQSILVITGSVTSEEAQARVDAVVGANTQLIIIKNTSQLTNLELPQVNRLTEIQIEGNRALEEVNFPHLLQVDDKIKIANNASGSLKVSMNSLSRVTGNMEFSNNGSLDLELNKLEEAFWIQVLDQNNFDLDLPQLRQALVLEVSGSIGTFNFNLPELTELGDLYINNNLVFDFLFSAPRLTELTLMEINRNETIGPGLTFTESFDLSGIKEINILSYQGNALFADFELPNIERIVSANIFSNSSLSSITLKNLSSTSNLLIMSNAALASVNLAGLQDFGGNFGIASNPLLTGINIDAFAATTDQRIAFNNNAFSSEMVNYILSRFASIDPPISGVSLNLRQASPAPPLGQGVVDKATLEKNGNIVTTD